MALVGGFSFRPFKKVPSIPKLTSPNLSLHFSLLHKTHQVRAFHNSRFSSLWIQSQYKYLNVFNQNTNILAGNRSSFISRRHFATEAPKEELEEVEEEESEEHSPRRGQRGRFDESEDGEEFEEPEVDDTFDPKEFEGGAEELVNNLREAQKNFEIPVEEGDYEALIMKKYDNLFANLAKEGKWDKLEDFYSNSKNMTGGFTDTLTYNLILADLVQKLDFQEIPKVLSEMEAQGIKGDEITQSFIDELEDVHPQDEEQQQKQQKQQKQEKSEESSGKGQRQSKKPSSFERLKKEVEKFEA